MSDDTNTATHVISDRAKWLAPRISTMIEYVGKRHYEYRMYCDGCGNHSGSNRDEVMKVEYSYYKGYVGCYWISWHLCPQCQSDVLAYLRSRRYSDIYMYITGHDKEVEEEERRQAEYALKEIIRQHSETYSQALKNFRDIIKVIGASEEKDNDYVAT